MLYVEAIILQITKDVTSIKNNITLSALPKDRILHKLPQMDFPPQPQAIPRSQHKTYAQALRGTEPTLASPSVDEPMSLPTFLREFNP